MSESESASYPIFTVDDLELFRGRFWHNSKKYKKSFDCRKLQFKDWIKLYPLVDKNPLEFQAAIVFESLKGGQTQLTFEQVKELSPDLIIELSTDIMNRSGVTMTALSTTENLLRNQ